jgi:tRNA-splicing ligase RtcB
MKVFEGEKVPIKAWIDGVQIEDEAMAQLHNLAKMPFIYKHIAVMPDVHFGLGATVGSVIATEGAIIPAAVGVDIGCGMCAVKLKFKVDDLGTSLDKLRSSIERSIPVGFGINTELTKRMWSAIKSTYPDGTPVKEKTFLQIGTLGGGNHFIEICADQNNDAWIVLHSGSRNIGNTMATKHIDIAKGLMKEYLSPYPIQILRI